MPKARNMYGISVLTVVATAAADTPMMVENNRKERNTSMAFTPLSPVPDPRHGWWPASAPKRCVHLNVHDLFFMSTLDFTRALA